MTRIGTEYSAKGIGRGEAFGALYARAFSVAFCIQFLHLHNKFVKVSQ